MTFDDFINVYDEPMVVEVVEPWGEIIPYRLEGRNHYKRLVNQAAVVGEEFPIYGMEEIDFIWHDEDGTLTVTLKEEE